MLAGHIFLIFVLLTSCVLCLEVNRKINVEYHEDTDDITVQINAEHFNYSSVQLELAMNGCSEKNKTILQRLSFNPHKFAEMKFPGPFKNSIYCVFVTPLNMLNKIESNEVYITYKLNCNDWQMNLITAPARNHDGTYHYTVTVNVESPFQSCFTSIVVVLFYGAYKDCDSASGREEKRKTASVAPDFQYTAVFEDLKPGNYCIRMQTSHSSCKGSCLDRYTDVKTFINTTSDTTSDIIGHFSSSATPESSSLIYIMGGCVIFIIIIVATVWMCYRKRPVLDLLLDAKGLTLPYLIELAKSKARKLEIVMLYSQDFEEHSDVVLALYHFLLNCFQVSSVRFDKEEEATISVNRSSWVENTLRTKSNRVFLLIESEGAVLQEGGRRKLKLLRPANEDSLDDVFPYALQLLKTGTRGLCDYKTVYVVKFGYTPVDLCLNCMVPNRRYTLPKHLFDLYFTLLDLPRPPLEVLKKFEDEMIKEWQGSYQDDLISKIEDASGVINKNPRIIQESFVEHDLFVCV